MNEWPVSPFFVSLCVCLSHSFHSPPHTHTNHPARSGTAKARDGEVCRVSLHTFIHPSIHPSFFSLLPSSPSPSSSSPSLSSLLSPSLPSPPSPSFLLVAFYSSSAMNLTPKALVIERDFQNARAKANYTSFPEFARRYVKHNKDGIGTWHSLTGQPRK